MAILFSCDRFYLWTHSFVCHHIEGGEEEEEEEYDDDDEKGEEKGKEEIKWPKKGGSGAMYCVKERRR